jgi:hypothetical protein
LRLAPFVLLDDPSFAFIGSLILLVVYIALVKALSVVHNVFLKVVFGFLSVLFLIINVVYLDIHNPKLETTAKCNGATYYITYGHPLGDEQWTYVQMSKWRGIFYESHFWGYAPDAGANEIRCDVDRKETLFLRFFAEPPTLTFIDGENPQSFYKYSGAQLSDKLYFMSEDWYIPTDCNQEEYWTCDVSVYVLYQCKSDYTDCNPLPITYTNGDIDFLELRANEATNEVSLFRQYMASDKETLVFTYGENTRCYEDGCTISNK